MLYCPTAGACFEETLPSSHPNAKWACTGDLTSLNCNMTCNDGYLYQDGSSWKVLSCGQVGQTEEYSWSSSEPMVCLRKYIHLCIHV